MEELIYNIVSEIVEHKDEIKIEKFVKNKNFWVFNNIKAGGNK